MPGNKCCGRLRLQPLTDCFYETTINVLIRANAFIDKLVGEEVTAWVGSIACACGSASNFAALGDSVNIATRLASSAGQGEAILSKATCEAAHIEDKELESREVQLRGKSNLLRSYMTGFEQGLSQPNLHKGKGGFRRPSPVLGTHKNMC